MNLKSDKTLADLVFDLASYFGVSVKEVLSDPKLPEYLESVRIAKEVNKRANEDYKKQSKIISKSKA